jgi:hypothetical protein
MTDQKKTTGPDKADYEVIKPFLFERRLRKAGERLALTVAQATFLLTGGFIRRVATAAAESSAETESAKASRGRKGGEA